MERLHWENEKFEADYWIVVQPNGVHTAMLVPGTLKEKATAIPRRTST